MVVEFVGGTLDKQQMKIQRFADYINSNGEIYNASLIQFKQLGWSYVWYQYAGMARESEIYT